MSRKFPCSHWKRHLRRSADCPLSAVCRSHSLPMSLLQKWSVSLGIVAMCNRKPTLHWFTPGLYIWVPEGEQTLERACRNCSSHCRALIALPPSDACLVPSPACSSSVSPTSGQVLSFFMGPTWRSPISKPVIAPREFMLSIWAQITCSSLNRLWPSRWYHVNGLTWVRVKTRNGLDPLILYGFRNRSD